MTGTEHVACKANIRKLSKILIRKLEERNHLEGTGLKVRIILKSILERNRGQVRVQLGAVVIQVKSTALLQ
jgi:hypothetical protein